MSQASKAYNAHLLDHYHHPRNYGRLDAPDLAHEENNPLCGDRIWLGLKLQDGRVSQVGFEGRGCAICIAATSMLTELLQGRSLEALRALGKEQMLEALGVPVKHTRLKCALLGLKIFRQAAFGETEWPE